MNRMNSFFLSFIISSALLLGGIFLYARQYDNTVEPVTQDEIYHSDNVNLEEL